MLSKQARSPFGWYIPNPTVGERDYHSCKLDDIEHAIEKAAAVALVEVRDDEIIVTMPGTSYAVTYCKPANTSQLLARRIAESDDKRTSMSLSESSHSGLEAC